MAAFAGVLAAIWFSAGLYYQSQQLKEQREQLREQREQFLENFEHLREDSRRNALLMAKDILGRMEERVLKCNPALSTLNDLSNLYMTSLPNWRIVGESHDAQEVLAAGQKWLTQVEIPADLLMSGIKSAAETYFRAFGTENIDYSKEPEEFVLVYGDTLWKLPFFGDYAGVAILLSEIMWRIGPGRAAIQLAVWAARLKAAEQGQTANILRKDKILDDFKKHQAAGYPLPAIAQEFVERAE
jgi:hypothetical protein